MYHLYLPFFAMTQSGMFFYIDKLVMHTTYATVRNKPYYERLSMWNHCGYLDRDILFLAKGTGEPNEIYHCPSGNHGVRDE